MFKRANPINNPNYPLHAVIVKCGKKITQSGYLSIWLTPNKVKEIESGYIRRKLSKHGLKNKIKAKLEELESDIRLGYSPANFETNYILAGEQIGLKAKIEVLKELLKGE